MMRCFSIAALAALVAGCSSSNVPVSVPVAGTALVYPLLYTADLGTSQVVVKSYPQGKDKFTISSSGSVNGLCVDFNGNVYVSDAHDNQVTEYEYGSTKQLRVLKDPGYYLGGCSVDLTSNDVAVATQPTNSNPGGIAIFRDGKGKAQNYTSTATYFAKDCTYDSAGNVYLDGTSLNGSFFAAELPHKSKVFTSLTLDQSIVAAGGVQWDGQHDLLAIDDQGVGYRGSIVYEFAIDGSTATEQSSTPLGGSSDVVGFTLDLSGKGRIVGANTGSTPSVMYWNYPKGGSCPSKTITGFSEPVSVVIAAEPSAARR
jgi:hypothetical protein